MSWLISLGGNCQFSALIYIISNIKNKVWRINAVNFLNYFNFIRK